MPPGLVEEARCRELFGDEREDYRAAMERYYADGPTPGWERDHVSAYATMHPWEDWAETFAHYLHLRDTLQTAAAYGVRVDGPSVATADLAPLESEPRAVGGDVGEMLEAWIPLTYALNAINRSMGSPGPLPVRPQPCRRTKARVHRRVDHGRSNRLGRDRLTLGSPPRRRDGHTAGKRAEGRGDDRCSRRAKGEPLDAHRRSCGRCRGLRLRLARPGGLCRAAGMRHVHRPGRLVRTGNWSTGKLPEPEQAACISGIVTFSAGEQKVDSIQGGHLILSGGSLEVTSTTNESKLQDVAISGGTLTLSGTLAAPVTLSGGTLTGEGTIRGTVENTGGTLAPGSPLGTLTVAEGDYVQGEGGTLRIAVDGSKATEYSVLDVEGDVELGGRLTLVPGSGYLKAAAAGDRLAVIPYTGELSGSFATTEAVPGLERGLGVAAESEPLEPVEALIVAPGTPEADLAPAISGGSFVGETLSATDGVWFNYIESRRLQWERCLPSGGSCTEISDATGQSYSTRGVDAGHTIRVLEYASNQSGTGGPNTSPATGPIESLPLPQNTSPPRITGHGEVGATLSCSPGGWAHATTGYAYEWTRDGGAIGGALTASYVLGAEDAGHSIACVVRGINASGAGLPARSAAIAVATVAPLPLRCGTREIEVTKMLLKGHSLYLGGVALPSLAGRRVTISLSGIPRRLAAGKGGKTNILANGTFALKLTTPSGSKAPLTIYTAKVAGHTSLPVKLGRELVLVGEQVVAGGVQVTFKGSGSLAKGSHPVTIVRETSCTASEVLTRKTMKKGLVTVLLPAGKTPGAASWIRAQTPVGHRLGYSLPIAVN